MATAKLQLSFRIFKNNQLLREESLNLGVIKIGKVPSAHLRIDDEAVSRMHAIIEVLGNEASLIDLGSTGGTFVNGQKVNKAKLQSGDTITIGETRIEVAIGEPAIATVIVSAVQPVSAPVHAVSAPVLPPPVPVVAMAATVTMPAAIVSKPATPSIAPPAMFQAAMASELDQPGARAVEVATMLGDSVINVKHCMDPRGGKVTRATWAFAATGLVCLLASAGAFYTSVATAARNKGALSVHLAKGKPERAFRPELVSPAVDVFAFGGLAIGLLGVTTALARSRRERKSPYFRIGTAANVEQPIEHAPSPSFPLVAPQGDDFVFNYAPGIEGEMIVDGKSTPLADLAAQGRARPSLTAAGAIEVPIPFAARIRARAGQTTFLVTAVAKPREQATPLFNGERRTLGYAAGSLALHLGVVALLSTIQTADAGVNVDLALNEGTLVRTASGVKEDLVPEKEENKETGENSGEKGAGATMALDEGMSGKPNAPRTDGQLAMKNNNAEPQMSREQAIEYARTAGVLGSQAAIKGGIASLTGSADFSSGFSDADIYGPLFGAAGEGRGNFGFGRKNWGPGGGCTQEPCGIVGTGRYGTIGDGNIPGNSRWGGGSWGRNGNRTSAVPQPTIGLPTATGNLDRAIIKRYIRRHLNEISYCYEKELLGRPGIEGSVMVNFLISGTGAVQQSQGSGFDGKVSTCLAGVIKNIEFPRPSDGGSVQVNYPFTFHAAGK